MEQPQSSSSQQLTPANELVPLEFQVAIGRCNNKTTLQNIPCLKECKQVPNANNTTHFMVDKKDIIYTLDMFRTALKLPTKTVEKLFIPPADFPYINEFLKIISYQGQLQRVTGFFVKNLAQPW
ncbi:hypothetical protein Tco_0205842 [Tanacetum coccineum]